MYCCKSFENISGYLQKCLFKVRVQKKWVTCVTLHGSMILEVEFHFVIPVNFNMIQCPYCYEICIMDL